MIRLYLLKYALRHQLPRTFLLDPFIFSGLRLSRPLVFFLSFTPWRPFLLSGV